jgi:hypothetical protein
MFTMDAVIPTRVRWACSIVWYAGAIYGYVSFGLHAYDAVSESPMHKIDGKSGSPLNHGGVNRKCGFVVYVLK